MKKGFSFSDTTFPKLVLKWQPFLIVFCKFLQHCFYPKFLVYFVLGMTRSYTKPNGFFHLFFITVAIGILMKFSLCLSITTICLWAYYESQKVVEETITLIRGLGIQCQESTLFTKREPIFIEKKRIKQCYLNEGFLACDIIFFLTLEIEMEDGEINNKLVG